MLFRIFLIFNVFFAALLPQTTLMAADTEAYPELIKVTEQLYVAKGRGGNVGVFVGEDGVFLIDDQYAPASKPLLKAIEKVSDKPLGYVINTHWHGDHTGGNENMAAVGGLVVAHQNVRKRMSSEQLIKLFDRSVPASPEAALPVITFTESLSFYLNGDQLSVMHMPHAHTDGDSIIHFKQTNAIHMGDIYFSGTFPFIDTSSGGSILGLINAVNNALTLADDNTVIIPGHGDLSTPQALAEYRDMLITAKQLIEQQLEKGFTLEQIQANQPLAELEEKWGQGFIKADVFTTMLVDNLNQ